MRRIRWTTQASDQVRSGHRTYTQRESTAALRVARAIIDSIKKLLTFPGMGRPGEIAGTRELVCPPYIVVYRYTDEIVHILFLWHGSQDWK